MTSTRTRLRRLAGVLSAAVVLTALSGCSAFDGLTGDDDPAETSSTSPQASETPYDSEFTREREVVTAIVEGFTNREIAEKFKISERTVKHHLSNIFDKLGVSTRLELALFAVNQSLPLKTII